MTKNIRCIMVGNFLRENDPTEITRVSFENMKSGFFQAEVELERTGSSSFNLKGTMEDQFGTSKIEGKILGPLLKFYKTYIKPKGHALTEEIFYDLGRVNDHKHDPEIKGSFVGSWSSNAEGKGIAGRAACSFIFEG